MFLIIIKNKVEYVRHDPSLERQPTGMQIASLIWTVQGMTHGDDGVPSSEADTTAHRRFIALDNKEVQWDIRVSSHVNDQESSVAVEADYHTEFLAKDVAIKLIEGVLDLSSSGAGIFSNNSGAEVVDSLYANRIEKVQDRLRVYCEDTSWIRLGIGQSLVAECNPIEGTMRVIKGLSYFLFGGDLSPVDIYNFETTLYKPELEKHTIGLADVFDGYSLPEITQSDVLAVSRMVGHFVKGGKHRCAYGNPDVVRGVGASWPAEIVSFSEMI